MVRKWRSADRGAENKSDRQRVRTKRPLPAQGLETKGEISAKGRGRKKGGERERAV